MASAILKKILMFRALKFKEGNLILWGIPGMLSPLSTIIQLQRVLEKKLGKGASKLMYYLGKFQGLEGAKLSNEKFGYAKKITDKRKLLEFSTGQSEVTGLGIFKWVVVDFNKGFFVARGKSSIGLEYKKIYGIQRSPVDHFIRGQGAAMVEGIINREVFCIETKCVSMGHPYCEFIVRPIEKNKGHEEVKF